MDEIYGNDGIEQEPNKHKKKTPQGKPKKLSEGFITGDFPF